MKAIYIGNNILKDRDKNQYPIVGNHSFEVGKEYEEGKDYEIIRVEQETGMPGERVYKGLFASQLPKDEKFLPPDLCVL